MVLLRETSRDWLLVGAVLLISVAANLPPHWTEMLSVDRRYLIGALLAVLAVALVRYLKFTLLLVIVILIVGANLPEELASQLGIDPIIMLLTLVSMILVSFANRLLKLPSGMDRPNGRSTSAHGVAALFTAVLKGRVSMVQTLLDQGVNVNARTVTGKTPLMAAAYKGYGDVVQLLLEHGADATARDGSGTGALQIAERSGNTRVVELLRRAGARA